MDVVVLTHHAKYEGSINVSTIAQASRLHAELLSMPSVCQPNSRIARRSSRSMS